MRAASTPMRWATPAYAALLALALVAFWPGYLALPKSRFSGWFHLHAVAAVLWIFMLIAQPWAIHSGRRALHRLIGRASYVLMPVLVISFVGLAHDVMHGKTGAEAATQAYFFYIRVVLVAIFVGCYAMAVGNRRNAAVHSRYMLCTGLALVDPVVHRVASRFMHGADVNYQLLTFGLVLAILAMLIWLERDARAGRGVFPTVFAAFFVGGLPLALDFHTWGTPWSLWKSVSAGFAALPFP
jgi:hypothetical protein